MCFGATSLPNAGAGACRQPDVEVLDLVGGADESIAAYVLLHFAVGITGPLLLGRDSHQGGGLFIADR